jgi:hypothetical protein
MHERCGVRFGRRFYVAGASSKPIGPPRRQSDAEKPGSRLAHRDDFACGFAALFPSTEPWPRGAGIDPAPAHA